jgi:hypothetical protein
VRSAAQCAGRRVTREGRPGERAANDLAGSGIDTHDTACAAPRRRRTDSYRCAALVCGRRDPLDPLGTSGPSTFGLTPDELRAEANRLAGLGWAREEVTARLAVALRREVVR